MSRIKGITIELDGDTKGLDKALSDVNSRSRDVTKELRQVERLLKFNPGNTELIAQKQKLLGDQVANTREKLNKLKDAQAEVQKQFEKGEISEEQYRAFQREIVETESKLKHYESQIEQTQSKLDKFGEKIGETGEKFKDAGDKMTSAGKDMSKKVTAPLMGIAAASIKVGSDFETGMSSVQAISGATGDDLDKLTETAREFGSSTSFSATEAANGLEALALAGWDTTQMTEGLGPVLHLAEAGNIALDRSAELVTNSMAAMGIEVQDLDAYLDKVATTASNADTDIDTLMEAFVVAGGTFERLNIPLEESSSLLGIMADEGFKGSEAGTAVNAIMSRLTKTTGPAADALADMGVNVFDTEGNFRGLETVLSEVSNGVAEMTDEQRENALTQIAGLNHGKSFNAMLDITGDKYGDLQEKVSDSTGALEKMRDIMKDNLGGRIEEMQSALSDVAITIYNNLQPAIESLVGFVTRLAEWFSELSPTMQNTIVVIGGLAAAIGPLLIVFGAMASGMGSIMETGSKLIENWGMISGAGAKLMGGLKATVGFIFSPAGAIMLGIAAVIAIGVLLYKNWDVIKEKASDFTDKVVETWSEMMDWFNELPAKFKEIWESVKKSVADWVKEMVEKAIEVGTDFIKSITEFFDDLPRKMGYWLGETIAKVIIWVADMIAKARETGSKFLENITNFFQTLPSRIQTWLSNAYTNVTTWASNMRTKASEAGRNFLNKVIEWVKQLPERVQTWLSNTITRLTTWVSDMGSKGKEAGLDLLNKTVDAVKELPSKMATAGADVVKGFWKGITSMGTWIRDKVTGFFGGIVDGVKDTLKIKSPSRVFMELGEFTGEGFEEGLLAMSGRVEQASRKMAEHAILDKRQMTINEGSRRDRSSTNRGDTQRGDIIQNITINSPDSMSPAETARQIKNASRQLAMEWGG